jgi:hypothetical protein
VVPKPHEPSDFYEARVQKFLRQESNQRGVVIQSIENRIDLPLRDIMFCPDQALPELQVQNRFDLLLRNIDNILLLESLEGYRKFEFNEPYVLPKAPQALAAFLHNKCLQEMIKSEQTCFKRQLESQIVVYQRDKYLFRRMAQIKKVITSPSITFSQKIKQLIKSFTPAVLAPFLTRIWRELKPLKQKLIKSS